MSDNQKNPAPANRDPKKAENVEDLSARDASGNDDQVKGGRMKLDPLKKGNT
jgi:hypothetical protein